MDGVQTFEMAANVTIKDIAQKAGVHFSTVSLALRNDPRLSDATRQRIQELAVEMGYTPNAAMKALCAYRESNRPHPVRSGLAYLTDQPIANGGFGEMVYRVAREQAARLGYNLLYFNLNEPGLTLDRLRSIWWSRGLKGVLTGTLETPGITLDDKWDQWIVVAFGYSIERPNFNRAVQDYFTNMLNHLSILRQRGYRRIGLHLLDSMGRRTHGLLQGAYLFDQAHHRSPRIAVAGDEIDTPEALKAWIVEKRIEVLVAEADIYDLLCKTDLKVPEEVGFSLLSWKQYDPENPNHCAGFDMKAEVLAKNAVSFLVSQIHENNYGISDSPKCLTVAGHFCDGDTLRPAKTNA